MLFWFHLAELIILGLYLWKWYSVTICWSRGSSWCTWSWICHDLGWRFLMSFSGLRVNWFLSLLYLVLLCFLFRLMFALINPFFHILLLHICVILFCACSFGLMVASWYEGPRVIFFFICPAPPVASNSIYTISFVFVLVIFFLRVAFVTVRDDMVYLSPVVSLERLVVSYSASFSIFVSPSSDAVELFTWYLAVFNVDWYAQRSWWEVVKSDLEVSHVFGADILFL